MIFLTICSIAAAIYLLLCFETWKQVRHCKLLEKTAYCEMEIFGNVTPYLMDHMRYCQDKPGVHALWRAGLLNDRVAETPDDVDIKITQEKYCKKYGHQWRLDGTCAFCPKKHSRIGRK